MAANDDEVFGYTALVAGDGRAQMHWLLDRRAQTVALFIALPTLDAAATEPVTLLASLPPAR